ncbi:MAG TPA: hypothetical protein ENK83_01800, partial [Aliiroseovarius sp.]|nr:hypothetical protein [Aliiroseovarius sp.]
MTIPVKWGHEFLVNTPVADNQREPVVTGLADGRFVIAYTDYSNTTLNGGDDTDDRAVRLEIFNTDGSHAGPPIQANTATADLQDTPSLAALAGGGFVVAWRDRSEGTQSGLDDPSLSAVRMQIFGADGAGIGGERLANSVVTGNQNAPSVAVLGNGQFVVAYGDFSQGVETGDDDTSSYAVRADVFNADGTRATGAVLVNTHTTSSQAKPSVAALAGGNRFVVVFNDYSGEGADTSVGAVRGQILEADGTKVGESFQVNTAADSGQYRPQVAALADGGFVAVWDDGSRGGDTGGDDVSSFAVRGQMFSATGARVGSEVLVNTITENGQQDVSVAALSGGGFIVVWQGHSSGQGGTNDDPDVAVRAQVFDDTGAKSGEEFLVNTTTAGTQGDPSVAELPDGRIVIAWMDVSRGVETGDDDTDLGAIRAQIFDTRTEAIDWKGTSEGEQFAGTKLRDKLNGLGGDDFIAGAGGRDLVKGGSGADTLSGGAGNDRILGGAGADTLNGDAGKDRLSGGKQGDVIMGGLGKDILKGGKGNDVFVFTSADDSGALAKQRDTILDFRPGKDVIDLSAVEIEGFDAEHAFTWLGRGKFSGTEGELRFSATKKHTIVTGDTDSDGVADFSIELKGRIRL